MTTWIDYGLEISARTELIWCSLKVLELSLGNILDTTVFDETWPELMINGPIEDTVPLRNPCKKAQ